MLKIISVSQFFLVALTAGASAQVDPQLQWWTTVASAGTVDETDLETVTQEGPTVALKVNAPAATIRFNVGPVATFFNPLYKCWRLKVRYRDEYNHPSNVPSIDKGRNVVVKLKEMDISNGNEKERIVFDSNAFKENFGYLTLYSADEKFDFDFAKSAYWIEAYLVNGVLQGNFKRLPASAALASVQIVGGCPPSK